MWFVTTRMYLRLKVDYERAASELKASEQARERLELEYERLRHDFQAVVSMLGNQAQRPVGKTLTDDDIFKEQTDMLDTFLSPAPDEYVAGDEVLNRLGDEDGK